MTISMATGSGTWRWLAVGAFVTAGVSACSAGPASGGIADASVDRAARDGGEDGAGRDTRIRPSDGDGAKADEAMLDGARGGGGGADAHPSDGAGPEKDGSTPAPVRDSAGGPESNDARESGSGGHGGEDRGADADREAGGAGGASVDADREAGGSAGASVDADREAGGSGGASADADREAGGAGGTADCIGNDLLDPYTVCMCTRCYEVTEACWGSKSCSSAQVDYDKCLAEADALDDRDAGAAAEAACIATAKAADPLFGPYYDCEVANRCVEASLAAGRTSSISVPRFAARAQSTKP